MVICGRLWRHEDFPRHSCSEGFHLHRPTADDRIRNPYPYIVVKNALHPCLYKALEDSFPSDSQIIDLSPVTPSEVTQNMRVDIWAKTVLKEPSPVPEIWRRFVQYHTSPEFYGEVNRLLGGVIRQHHKVSSLHLPP